MKRLAILLSAIAILALLAACGGDDDDDGGSGEAETTSTATTAPDSASNPTATMAPTATEGQSDLPQLILPPTRSDDIPQNGRTLGNPDASVVLVEFGDFQ